MALAFSCLSGILGVIVVAWYGLVPDPGTAHPEQGIIPGAGTVTETEIHAKQGGSDGGSLDAPASGAAADSPPVMVTSVSGGANSRG